MKKCVFALLCSFMVLSMSSAESADVIVNNVVKAYNASKGISVGYIITTDEGQTNGTITMQGEKFRMISADLKCWFNGTLQWSYMPATGEVNITAPTAEELQMINPYSIVSSFRNSFSAHLLKSATASNNEVELRPKNAKTSDIASVRLTISKKTNLPVKIVFALKDKSTLIVSLHNYKTGANYPASTFVFNKTMVPAGTPVVDLR